MWEKRRQLSAILHRALARKRPLLAMSCDDLATFFGRIDLPFEQSVAALDTRSLEYLQIAPLFGNPPRPVFDLSRVMGPLGGRLSRARHAPELVVLDDVDLILDLRSTEAAQSSMAALLYALHARFREVVLLANPLRSERELETLAQLRAQLTVHAA